MLAYRVTNKYLQNKILHPSAFKAIKQTYCSSKSDSDDEKKKAKPDAKIKSKEALNKLNVLLKQMIEDDTPVSKSQINLAKPKPRVRNENTEAGTVSSSSEQIEKQIISAAKNVAETLGGNTKQTESELLSKLLGSNIAEEESKNKSMNLSDVLSGMKIDRTVKPTVYNNEVSRAHQVRQLLDKTSRKQSDSSQKPATNRIIRKPKYAPQTEIQKINLFGANALGIFTSKTEDKKVELKSSDELKIWNSLQERELRLAVTHPPENYFQEMILWTEQGKVWKFPIDNEQGMEEEQNVYFAEHVFLDKHLEDWCPTKGPIRHFMELVCVGLSKNSYLTAQAKKEHIMWYKEYFLSRKQMLEEMGAMPVSNKINELAEK